MNYQALIHTLVDSFISDPESLLIKELPQENDSDITILLCAKNEDCARLIGKKGCVANSLRDILNIAGKLEEKHVHLKLESFDDEDKDQKEDK
jgi:uncharacterized protein